MRHLLTTALLLTALACTQDRALETAEPTPPHPTPQPEHILLPEGFGRLESHTHLDTHGRPLQVRCSTCHDAERGQPMKGSPHLIQTVHAGLNLQHGHLPCAACHHPDDRDRLRLADGSTLPFEEVNSLCGQCHGTQHRDYKHGAHGGMRGAWDRTRGPRTRNACVVCHDPHAPAITQVMPAAPPRDLPTPHDGAHP